MRPYAAVAVAFLGLMFALTAGVVTAAVIWGRR